MACRKKWQGVTLLELLVGMFLVGLLMTVLARVASTAYRVGHEEIERGSIEARVLWIAKKLQEDLAEASPAGVSLADDGSRVMVHPLGEPLSSGRVPFQEKFVFWSHQEATGSNPARLTRRELSARPDGEPFDGSAFRWTTTELMSLAGGGTDGATLVANGVVRFEVKNHWPVDPPLVGSLLDFEIEAPIPQATTRKSILWKGTVQVRNGGAVNERPVPQPSASPS